MRYKKINHNLFINNRVNFSKELLTNSVAVFHANDLMPRNGDTFFPFRQNSDLFYLSGIDQEETILVLHKKENVTEEYLFIKETDETIKIWEGNKLEKDEANSISGINNIAWLDEFETVLEKLINYSNNIYVNINNNPRFTSDIEDSNKRFYSKVKKQYPEKNILTSDKILTDLRKIKSKEEVELIKKAISITNDAFHRVLEFTKPNVKEYEIEAEITHEFTRQGANGHAYTPIIASGIDSCTLHYIENNKVCKDGDVLLMDFGAEYANYASDLTRTIPVNGKFSKRQKEVYNAVLNTMKFAKTILISGTTISEYHKKVCDFIENEMIGIGLLTKDDLFDKTTNKPRFQKYYMHGTSHYIGLDVHDLGDKDEIIMPGMFFSCEPGIYIPEEEIGIRLENDILITENGNIDLTEDIPIEIEEIEKLML